MKTHRAKSKKDLKVKDTDLSDQNGKETVANVNNSHATARQTQKRSGIPPSPINQPKGKVAKLKQKLKSVVVVPSTSKHGGGSEQKDESARKSNRIIQNFEFDEGDETVTMEFEVENRDDFASENENNETLDSEPDSQDSSSETEPKSGELDDENTQNTKNPDEELGNEVTSEQNSQESFISNDETRSEEKRKEVTSMEEKLENLSSSVLALQELVLKQHEAKEKETKSKQKKKKKTKEKIKGDVEGKGGQPLNSNSETTIYQNVLQRIDDDVQSTVRVDDEIAFKKSSCLPKHDSSSSDEQADTSEELIGMEDELNDMNEHFIADCEKEAKHRRSSLIEMSDPEIDARDKAFDMIKQAEASRARTATTPGRVHDNLMTVDHSSTSVDDNYVVIGAHIEIAIQDKIKRGQYVDFVKLLPKEKTLMMIG